VKKPKGDYINNTADNRTNLDVISEGVELVQVQQPAEH